MIKQGQAGYAVSEVVLHCTGGNPASFVGKSPFQIFAEINRDHRENRGWKNGFGYHGLITPDGVWYRGRPFHMIGAHVIGHNRGTLGFLLIESKRVDRMGVFSDFYTEVQLRTLRLLLDDLRQKGVTSYSGHTNLKENNADLCRS